jgi:hypothetical protein
VCTLTGGRAARIFEAVRRAADASPEVTDLWNTLQHNRRAGAGMVVRRPDSPGPLPPGLTGSRATDLLRILNDPAHYNALVLEYGWSEKALGTGCHARCAAPCFSPDSGCAPSAPSATASAPAGCVRAS